MSRSLIPGVPINYYQLLFAYLMCKKPMNFVFVSTFNQLLTIATPP